MAVSDVSKGMRYLILTLTTAIWSCSAPSSAPAVDVRPNPTCEGLFGAPNEKSGFESDACTTQCQCATMVTQAHTLGLNSPLFDAVHTNPAPALDDDPYTGANRLPTNDTNDLVCTIDVSSDDQSYTLSTVHRTQADPNQVTHTGSCGLCSSLQDFRVYATQTDLTDPVRSCGFMGISNGMAANIACLEEIGFSPNCALIWYYNTLNTRTECLDECLAHLNSPYVDESGQLNPCLQCDELKSGPVFKYISGRTRRNSAIPSAICRPCNSVSTLTHHYLSE